MPDMDDLLQPLLDHPTHRPTPVASVQVQARARTRRRHRITGVLATVAVLAATAGALLALRPDPGPTRLGVATNRGTSTASVEPTVTTPTEPTTATPASPFTAIVVIDYDSHLTEVDASGRPGEEWSTAGLDRVIEVSSTGRDDTLYVTTEPKPNGQVCGVKSTIYRLAGPDAAAERIAEGAHPAPSPGGSQLAYFRFRKGDTYCDQATLVVRNLDTGTERTWDYSDQSDDPATPINKIVWSPDGTALAFGSSEGSVRYRDLSTGATELVPTGDSLPSQYVLPGWIGEDVPQLVAVARISAQPPGFGLYAVDLAGHRLVDPPLATGVPGMVAVSADRAQALISDTSDGEEHVVRLLDLKTFQTKVIANMPTVFHDGAFITR